MPPNYLNPDEDDDEEQSSPASTASSTWSDNSANATPQKQKSGWSKTLSMLGQIGKGYAKGGIGGAVVAGVKQVRDKKYQAEPGNYGY